jgi:predicted metal-binding membrane protein
MATAIQTLSPIERLVRRDRLVIGCALAIITLLAWIYLIRMAASMQGAADEAAMHAAMGMTMDSPWALADIWMLFVMWSVMMAGMMLPSAAPVIMLVVGTYRRRGGSSARVAAVFFIVGYLAAWTGFSALATLLQTYLHQISLLSGYMRANSLWLAGGIFLVAGIYQWLPWKAACLSHCQSPIQFLSAHWREGTGGGFRMGLHHGLFCVGCCWALMLLLFAAGVMNLLWVAAIAAFVLAEKILPRSEWIGRAAGILMIVWGGYLLTRLA